LSALEDGEEQGPLGVDGGGGVAVVEALVQAFCS